MAATPRPVRLDWTPRQRQVLDLITAGLTNGQIAERLGITLYGAKWHVSEVLTKLGVATREEAAQYWRHEQALKTRTARLLAPLVLLAPKALAAVVAVLAVAGVAVGALSLRSGDDGRSSDLLASGNAADARLAGRQPGATADWHFGEGDLFEARMDLAGRLQVNPLDISIYSMIPEQWDACLNVYPKDNVGCDTPAVAGHIVGLRADELVYVYRVGYGRFVAMDWVKDVVIHDGRQEPWFSGDFRRLFEFARLDLALRVAGNSGAVRIDSIVPVEFDDGCLGFERTPAVACQPGPIRGAIVHLRAGGKQYIYHVALKGVVATDFEPGTRRTVADPQTLDLIRRMREHLAMRTSVESGVIVVTNARLVTWADGCLGVVPPGATCPPGQVEGIQVSFELRAGDGGPSFDPSYRGITWHYNGSTTDFVAGSPGDEDTQFQSPTAYRDLDQ